MVHAGLGLKSLSGFIWLSSQTHTERVGDVSKYLLCSCEGGAAPQLLYRGTEPRGHCCVFQEVQLFQG